MSAPHDDGRLGEDSSARARSAALANAPRVRHGFHFPLGIEMIEGENYRQREGYDVTYLKDEEIPRYQYTAAVGADRAGELFGRLATLLPEPVCAILEIPSAEHDNDKDDVCDIWMGRPVPRDVFLRAFEPHSYLFVNDGMVGFGAVSSDGEAELFLDEHKLIYLYVKDMEAADGVLGAFGLRALPVLRHFSELAHVHTSLSPAACGSTGPAEVRRPYWETAKELRDSLGLRWEESKEYT